MPRMRQSECQGQVIASSSICVTGRCRPSAFAEFQVRRPLALRAHSCARSGARPVARYARESSERASASSRLRLASRLRLGRSPSRPSRLGIARAHFCASPHRELAIIVERKRSTRPCIHSGTSGNEVPWKLGRGVSKSELTRFRNGCQRRATARCHPSRRVHRRDGERHGVACDILQRRRGALQHVTAGGDGAAEGGRDSARFTERTGATPEAESSPRSGRSTGSREPGPPALHGE